MATIRKFYDLSRVSGRLPNKCYRLPGQVNCPSRTNTKFGPFGIYFKEKTELISINRKLLFYSLHNTQVFKKTGGVTADRTCFSAYSCLNNFFVYH